jgi:geranylgeranyl pyrophosphate synthase
MNIVKEMARFKETFEPIFQKKIESILKEQRDFHKFETNLDIPLKKIIINYTQGGKRIRPFLIYFFSNKSEKNTIMDACIANELFHLAALIHDDIMDKSEMRQNKHLGTDIALLLGDVFLIESIALGSSLPKELSTEFRLMAQRTTRGQYLDAFGMNTSLGENSWGEVRARHELKTAWYTFVSPFRIGYLLSPNSSNKICNILSPLLCELGLLFQIRDDIIDCIDTNSGKERFGDILENQTTWVTLYIKDNYPEILSEIIIAKNKKDCAALENIFAILDLYKPYQCEFKKRHDMIINLDKSYDEHKGKLLDVLELLKLK